jgi:hypothetical protein
MRLLFAINEPYLPETIGGGVLAIHHLAVELHNLGHFCEVVCCLGPSARQLAYRLVRKFSSKRWNPYVQSQTHGYRTFRAPNASAVAALLQDRLGVFRPDVVITQGAGLEALAQEVLKAGYPVLIRAVTAECVYCRVRSRTAPHGITDDLSPDPFRRGTGP